MARGSQVKEEITKKILETFENSFLYEKEIRIPMMENGELIQVKVTLTAAKTNVNAGGDSAMPDSQISVAPPAASLQITPQEKEETISLIERLGL